MGDFDGSFQNREILLKPLKWVIAVDEMESPGHKSSMMVY
jgi:hypothetical protein